MLAKRGSLAKELSDHPQKKLYHPESVEATFSLIFDKLVEMRDAGYTLMLVEQNATRALAVADRGYVLELGRNRFEGAGAQLLADPEVKRLYLGG